MPKNTETTNETNEQDATSMLVGYVRRSGAGGALKVSIDTEAIQACSTYTTSDGRAYAPLVISLRDALDTTTVGGLKTMAPAWSRRPTSSRRSLQQFSDISQRNYLPCP